MQNSEAKISIIMPVYNVEDYIKKAVYSILNQSHKNFELFLVDDGSIDKSGEICDELSKQDNRIIVIHQNNQGAHRARNNALKSASGEYVCFFDSDDYIEQNMLEELLDVATKFNSNLVISGFYIETYFNSNEYISLNYLPFTRNNALIDNFDNKTLFRQFAYKNFDVNMFYSPWNKLYKLSYIKENNIEFPITYRDDFPFVLSVIKDINNVTFVNKQYYHFIRKRADSETQKFIENLYEKREEEHLNMLDLYTHWGLINDKNSFEMISRRYIDRIIECTVNLFNSECKLTKSQKRLQIKNYLSNIYFSESIVAARPKKLYLKLMYIPLRIKNVGLCYFMAYIINTVKTKNIKLFSVLKTNR